MMDRLSEEYIEAIDRNSHVDIDYENTRLSDPTYTNQKNGKLCTYYSNFEFCRFGDSCKFLHLRQNASKQFVPKRHTGSKNKMPSTNSKSFSIEDQISNAPHNPSTSKKPCHYFKAGTCDRGDKCLFSHTFNNNSQQCPTPQSFIYTARNSSRVPNAKKISIPICWYFKRGYCKDGDRCKFYHPQKPFPYLKVERHLNQGGSKILTSELKKLDCKEIAPTNPRESEENECLKNNSENISSTNYVAQNKSCDKNNRRSLEQDEMCKSENNNSKESEELMCQVNSTNSIVISNASKDIKIPLSANKIFSLSLGEDLISQLRLTEISQFMKRFPSYEVIEDGVFVFTFQPSDPDWDFDLKVLKLQVKFPVMYPKEICSINVVRTEDYIPETLFRHLNESICDWLNNRHKAAIESEQVELLFRPFLKWFDKNVECIFNVGLKRAELDGESTASDQELPTNESTDTSILSTGDFLTDENPVVSTEDNLVTKSMSQITISQKKNVPSPSICTAQNQGVKVLFIGLEFIEGVAALSCTRIAAMLRCIRCKTSHNIKSPPNKNMAVTCSKCSKRLESNFNPSLLHQFSNVLGTMHLVECQVVDINLVESAFLIDCLNCSKQVGVNGIHYGQKQKLWCMFCNQKLVIGIGSVKFQASAPTYASTKAPDKAVKKTEKKKDSVIKEGAPLPQFGACKHYKKSNRWLRFPCCGRVYPCDLCHEEKEMDHEMKFASRMICGFCSKEQPYSKDKPCTSCASGMVAKSGTHWEGGKGCRNKVKMARDDKHKYAGTSKTVSNKAQSSGKKKK
ncbi:hypothetical protein JTE90_019742 [Oedothorax gibbosus]|uniref:Nucleoporin NUP42 n=1 Tax=Oedothorax gibbosus TaxID=931172 RepID=A0AAV6UP33_9ARAC|nr:hypothetical protein JTE90_019742 [Oedothorax gibbosus]